MEEKELEELIEKRISNFESTIKSMEGLDVSGFEMKKELLESILEEYRGETDFKTIGG